MHCKMEGVRGSWNWRECEVDRMRDGKNVRCMEYMMGEHEM